MSCVCVFVQGEELLLESHIIKTKTMRVTAAFVSVRSECETHIGHVSMSIQPLLIRVFIWSVLTKNLLQNNFKQFCRVVLSKTFNWTNLALKIP